MVEKIEVCTKLIAVSPCVAWVSGGRKIIINTNADYFSFGVFENPCYLWLPGY